MFDPTGPDASRTEPQQAQQAVRGHSGRARNGMNGRVNQTTRNLPDSVVVSQRGAVTLVRLSRPAKRNAIDAEMIADIERAACRRGHGPLSWRERAAIFAPAPIWTSLRRSTGRLPFACHGHGTVVCTENSNSHVVVMQSAEERTRRDATDRLNRAREWRVFVQRLKGVDSLARAAIAGLMRGG